MNKPFKKVGYLGLLVIGMSIVLLTVFPSTAPWMMDGFFTPIITFEFLQSQSEVLRFFGVPGSPEQLSMIQAMDFGNQLDYIYMILYSSFLFFFSFRCAKNTGKKFYFTGSILSVLILIADALENVQLLNITTKITSQDFDKELSLLHYFTWIKWGGITVVFLILTPYFLKGQNFSKGIAAIGISSFIISVLAYLHRSVLNELLCLFVAIMFLMMIVYSFLYKTASNET
jgi:hypothetical protein